MSKSESDHSNSGGGTDFGDVGMDAAADETKVPSLAAGLLTDFLESMTTGSKPGGQAPCTLVFLAGSIESACHFTEL